MRTINQKNWQQNIDSNVGGLHPIVGNRVDPTKAIIKGIIGDRVGLRIVEIGSSSCENVTYYTDAHKITVIDPNPYAFDAFNARFNSALEFVRKMVEDVEPIECDLLIMCEVLEHLWEPVSVVEKWFPKAADVVVSHPLHESDDMGAWAGGGTHRWSFNESDFDRWFLLGGHQQCHREIIIDSGTPFGDHLTILGNGKRANHGLSTSASASS